MEKSMAKITYYDILGVKKFADIQEIQSSYRQLVKLVHPDSVDAKKKILDVSVYQNVKEAYEVLSNPERKKKYDTELRRETLKQILFRPGLILAFILVYWYVKSPPAIPSRFPLHYTDGVFRVPSVKEWSSWLLTTKGAVFWNFLWSQHKMLVFGYIFSGIFVLVIAIIYFFYCMKLAKTAVKIAATKLPEANFFGFGKNRQLALPEAKQSLVGRILKAAEQKRNG